MGSCASSKKDEKIVKLEEKVTKLQAKLTDLQDMNHALRKQKFREDEALKLKLKYKSLLKFNISNEK